MLQRLSDTEPNVSLVLSLLLLLSVPKSEVVRNRHIRADIYLIKESSIIIVVNVERLRVSLCLLRLKGLEETSGRRRVCRHCQLRQEGGVPALRAVVLGYHGDTSRRRAG